MRKLFPCGHRGKGRYCHRCEQVVRDRLDEEEKERLAALRSRRAAQIMAAQAAQRQAEREHLRDLARRAAEEKAAEAAEKRRERLRLSAQDAIELDHLPPMVRDKARNMLRQLQEGCSLARLGGKRLINQTLISVPVGLRWRIVLRQTPDGMVPLQAMSHESYNRICSRPRI